MKVKVMVAALALCCMPIGAQAVTMIRTLQVGFWGGDPHRSTVVAYDYYGGSAIYDDTANFTITYPFGPFGPVSGDVTHTNVPDPNSGASLNLSHEVFVPGVGWLPSSVGVSEYWF